MYPNFDNAEKYFEKIIQIDYLVNKLFADFEINKNSNLYYYKNFRLLERLCEIIKNANNYIFLFLYRGSERLGTSSILNNLVDSFIKYFTSQTINDLKNLNFINEQDVGFILEIKQKNHLYFYIL